MKQVSGHVGLHVHLQCLLYQAYQHELLYMHVHVYLYGRKRSKVLRTCAKPLCKFSYHKICLNQSSVQIDIAIGNACNTSERQS